MLITLREYARLHNKDIRTTTHKAKTGGFKTAKKLGNQWVISSNEEWIDRRRKVIKEKKDV